MECKGRRCCLVFVEVEAGQAAVVLLVGVHHHQPVHDVRLADYLDPVTFLGHVLTDQQHVGEQETMDVNLGGGTFLQFEVSFQDEMSPIDVGTARHGAGEVKVAAGGQQTAQLVIFGFLKEGTNELA